MRKLIIKYLVLSYRVRLFGIGGAYPRAANVVFPIMLLLGYFLINNPNYPMPDFWTGIGLALTFFVWLLIIGYLRLHPARWHELDREQKWYKGNAWRMKKVLKDPLTKMQQQEYEAIDKVERYDKSKFHNLKKVSLNVVLTILLFVILVIRA